MGVLGTSCPGTTTSEEEAEGAKDGLASQVTQEGAEGCEAQ